MAARNARSHIDSAIAQIEAQTLDAYEIIVVDDASGDGTFERLQRWRSDNSRVTLLRNDERQGVAASRNRAVRCARGDFVWFADCDDFWSPYILDRLLGEARRLDADLVICGARLRRPGRGRDEDNIPGGGGSPVAGPQDALRRLMRGEIQGHLWNKLFRRDLFNDIEFPGTQAFSDLGAMGLLLARAEKVALLDEPLYTYVMHPESVLNSRQLRARDLLDCRDMMRAAMAYVPPSRGLARDFLLFEYAAVYLPGLNGIIRRDAQDSESRGICREIRSRVRPCEAARLAARGEWRFAAAAMTAKYAFGLYALAYKAFRRIKWGSSGFGCG